MDQPRPVFTFTYWVVTVLASSVIYTIYVILTTIIDLANNKRSNYWDITRRTYINLYVK